MKNLIDVVQTMNLMYLNKAVMNEILKKLILLIRVNSIDKRRY